MRWAGGCVAVTLSAGLVGAARPTVAAPATSCPTVVDARALASQAQLREWNSITARGLRSTAGPAHQRLVSWLDGQLRAIPGLRLRSLDHSIDRWQALPRAADGLDLEDAGRLKVRTGGGWTTVPVIGAVPYSRPTGARGQEGRLVYLPRGTDITPANARGKIVVRDVPAVSQPYAAFALLSHYLTPDLIGDLSGKYERPYLSTDGMLAEELKAAGRAGAAGMLVAFDVPREQLRGYFDPHTGTHFQLPAAYLGADEAAKIKRLARAGTRARVAVSAKKDRATARTLIATLPGGGSERVILETHTDGATWVQDNGPVALLALARYFASLPLACRPRTLEFAFGAGHLHQSPGGNGIVPYAEQIDRDYDRGTVALVLGLEHLGTRAYEAVPRDDGGPGRRLLATGRGEPISWTVPDGGPVAQTVISAVKRRGLDRTAVVRGTSLPTATVPPICQIGGDATPFHQRLVPTMEVISGPWTLWAPAFGSRAVDFSRMRRQILATADVVLALGPLTREQIAGPFPLYRKLRSAGAPTCLKS